MKQGTKIDIHVVVSSMIFAARDPLRAALAGGGALGDDPCYEFGSGPGERGTP
jgi:hypothetical protein